MNEQIQMPKATAHRCHSRDLLRDNGKRSSCLFQNICVVSSGKKTVQWLYIHDKNITRANISDIVYDDEVSFSLGVGPHSIENRLLFEPVPMKASDLVAQYPQRRYVPGVSVAFSEFNMENFGHVLTDQVLPVFALVESLGLEQKPIKPFVYTMPNPLPWSCACQMQPKHKSQERVGPGCHRFYKMFPKFLPSPHHPIEIFGNINYKTSNFKPSNNTLESAICFETLAAGMPLYSDDCLDNLDNGRNKNRWEECNHGKQALMWKYRDYVLTNLGVDTKPPTRQKITIAKRQDAKRGLVNFDQIVKAITETYRYVDSDVDVVVVEWHKLSLFEQFDLIRTTTVHLTPPGGVSFIAMFLPRWATSIRLYSFEWKLEWHFFNYISHIVTEHIDCRENRTCPIDAVMTRVDKGIRQYDSFLAVERSSDTG